MTNSLRLPLMAPPSIRSLFPDWYPRAESKWMTPRSAALVITDGSDAVMHPKDGSFTFGPVSPTARKVGFVFWAVFLAGAGAGGGGAVVSPAPGAGRPSPA